jgi:hypothetical protein
VHCAVGGYVYFHWTAAYHDLVLMASQSHMDACDFTGSTTLVATNTHAGPTGQVRHTPLLARRAARLVAPRALTTAAACSQAAYYLPCETAGTTLHLSCSHAGHCAAGQVLTVHVSATQHARDTNGTVLLHSDSLAAVMTLLGHRVDASTGFSYLDRGYSSEAAANASLELVWCLEAHCPTSALDFDAAATRDSCRAEVYNLAGFISRKVSAQHSQPWAPITHHPHLLVVLGPYERFVVRFRNASARSRPLAPPHAPSRSSIA